MRARSTLDWSQCKIFFVYYKIVVDRVQERAKLPFFVVQVVER